MTLIEAILLALIQGVTEFLPISSSAHLILMPFIFGWRGHSLTFDVVTNAGTLLAALVYFRRDLLAAGREVLERSVAGHGGLAEPGARRPGLIWAVLAASIPVLLAGGLFYDWLSTVARQPVVIAVMTIAFGLLLWWADRAAVHERPLEDLTWRDALWIGLAQAFALIPGTSRSGVTMTAALFLRLERPDAARFSFLLAIPVGIGALVKDLYELTREGTAGVELLPLVVGFVVSAVSAYLVIGWLLAWLRRQGMAVFVGYRMILGLVILVLASLR
ncbi:MAG: undecaprenyl-diphosphate phosphatase [bacterium]|nr:undecaprenyl-diphosphate phosphatase [bacterium]